MMQPKFNLNVQMYLNLLEEPQKSKFWLCRVAYFHIIYKLLFEYNDLCITMYISDVITSLQFAAYILIPLHVFIDIVLF